MNLGEEKLSIGIKSNEKFLSRNLSLHIQFEFESGKKDLIFPLIIKVLDTFSQTQIQNGSREMRLWAKTS